MLKNWELAEERSQAWMEWFSKNPLAAMEAIKLIQVPMVYVEHQPDSYPKEPWTVKIRQSTSTSRALQYETEDQANRVAKWILEFGQLCVYHDRKKRGDDQEII